MQHKKKIIILGSTGSIGSSTLDIIRNNPSLFTVVGLSAHKNKNSLLKLSNEFGLKNSILTSESGIQPLLEMIRRTDADIVVNGIAGASGLLPSIASIDSGKHLALANKETIVMAGPLIRKLANTKQKKILPVDSEHSAIFNLIEKFGKNSIAEVILTASGGPFRTWNTEQLVHATYSDALKHPTWSMGNKITIDSASMANKGLEVIEACRLFDLVPEQISVTVHPQSLVHSFIRTIDGTLYAQISLPDMRHPIVSALTWPAYLPNKIPQLDFKTLYTMQFEPPRLNDFPLLSLAFHAAKLSGSYPIAYNAANEIAVDFFCKGLLTFPQLSNVTKKIMDSDWSSEPSSFEEVFNADDKARQMAQEVIRGIIDV